MGDIVVARVYDVDALPRGRRFLVERLWPRGVRRADLRLEDWLRDVAPSAELRRWFDHDPERWSEFRRRYAAELDAAPAAWQPLLDAARSDTVGHGRAALQRPRPGAQQCAGLARLPHGPAVAATTGSPVGARRVCFDNGDWF